MFEKFSKNDDLAELERKLRFNTLEMDNIRGTYNSIQAEINGAIADAYAIKLEEARKKPDTQGVR